MSFSPITQPYNGGIASYGPLGKAPRGGSKKNESAGRPMSSKNGVGLT